MLHLEGMAVEGDVIGDLSHAKVAEVHGQRARAFQLVGRVINFLRDG